MASIRRVTESPFLAPTWIWLFVNIAGGAAIGFYSLSWTPRIAWPIAIGLLMVGVSIIDQRATIRSFKGGAELWSSVPRHVRWAFILRIFLLRSLIIVPPGIAAACIVGAIAPAYW